MCVGKNLSALHVNNNPLQIGSVSKSQFAFKDFNILLNMGSKRWLIESTKIEGEFLSNLIA